MVKIKGYFTDCIFQSENYGVYYFENQKISIVVYGEINDVNLNLEYEITGEYIEHPKYGLQFKIDFLMAILPLANQDIINFLTSDIFKGITKKIAEKIVLKLNGNDLSYLINNQEILNDIPKLKIEHRQNLIDVLTSFSLENQKIYILFQSCGISNSRIKNLFNYYKKSIFDVIYNNPYQILLDFKNFNFLEIDKVAFKLKIKNDNLNRLAAAISFLVIKICFNSGDSYIDVSRLKDNYLKFGLSLDKFDDALKLAINNKTVFLENDCLFHHSQYLSEVKISEFLINFNQKEFFENKTIETEIKLCEKINKIKYSKTQLMAIENFFKHSFSIITGGPGCGKTTVIKAIVNIYKNLYPLNSMIVLAPTGRATKRIQELCDVEAKTIHSLLIWKKNENDFIYNIDNPYFLDVLIIDEFSMVDPFIFTCLINGVIGVKKIVVIGDEKQLPSISCGNLLNDLIKSDIFKHTKLNNNYRQKKDNDIIQFSNDILNDSVDFNLYLNNIFKINLDIDFTYKNIINKINYFLDKNYSFNEIQILSPMYKGVLGIDNLNIFLQKAFNPYKENKKEVKFAKYIYRENDKVIQNKNRSDLDVYNGDIGIIKYIDNTNIKDIVIYIDFNDNLIAYSKKDLEDISLAYAISIHKSQGSEYKVVMIACDNEHSFMLDKQILYTAVTRAKEYCYIIGDDNLFISRCKINKNERNTKLKDRLNDKI